MNSRHLRAFVVFLFACGASERGYTAKIENEVLVISLDRGNAVFCSKALNRTFIPRAGFPSKVVAFAVRSHEDAIWGKGRELLLTHANGWTTALRLYPGQPFAHVLSTAVNRTDRPASMKQASLFSYEVDLGIPVEQVRVLGTGGLTGMQADGSYSWSAVVDPATRNGVVTFPP